MPKHNHEKWAFAKESHPLYQTWTWTKRAKNGRVERWNDFWIFVEDVGERPSKHHKLRRHDTDQPFSPENSYWWERLDIPVDQRKDKNAYMREWWARQTPEKRKDASLRGHYRIGYDEWRALYEKQRGVCAICGQEDRTIKPNGERRNLAVDHCHNSQKVRGLLCTGCNRGIGYLNHDTEILKAAIKYLEGGLI